MSINLFIKKFNVLVAAKELNSFFLAALLLALISGFDDGTKTFQFSHWVLNFITMFLISVLVLVVAEFSRKIYAHKQGYSVQFKLLPIALLIGLVFSIVSKGKIWYVLIPGTITITHITGMRIGKFRYGLNYFDMGKIAFSGTIAVLGLAIILKFLSYLAPNNLYLTKAMIFCISYAICNSLPIPYVNGHQMFFASRTAYFFILFFVIGLSFFLFITNPVLSVILALIFSAVFGTIYFMFFELKK